MVDTSQLPLFPLSTIVLPQGLLPLRLFERRYLDMVRDCFRQQSGFGVCLLQDGAEVGAVASPYAYGTLVRIIDWDQDDRGLLNIMVEGTDKFRINDTWSVKSGLLMGAVELLPAEKPCPVAEDLKYLQETMKQVLQQVAPTIVYQQPEFDDAEWLGNRFVELLPMAADVKHELVSLDDPAQRLAAIAGIMAAIARTDREDS